MYFIPEYASISFGHAVNITKANGTVCVQNTSTALQMHREAPCHRPGSRDVTEVKDETVTSFLVGTGDPTMSLPEKGLILFLRNLI
jgi:hypothetical protein